jgi:hypothetical protein
VSAPRGRLAGAQIPAPGRIAARVATSAGLAARDLLRNRVAVGLLLIVPIVLFVLVYVTTGERPIAFRLSVTGPTMLTASERELSLLFIALTAISGVSAFLAFLLLLRPIAADRRLVFEGYGPGELLLGKLLVVAGIAVIVAAYVTALLPLFAKPDGLSGVLFGFGLASLVYAALGLALGAIAPREIEGMLAILLLVNIDAGWLQSPVFYAHAHNQQLIRLLPAHYPGQVTMVSAFTTSGTSDPALASLGYALALIAVAGVAYWFRVRVER